MYLVTATLFSPSDDKLILKGTLYEKWFFTKKAARKIARMIRDLAIDLYGDNCEYRADIVRLFDMTIVETIKY